MRRVREAVHADEPEYDREELVAAARGRDAPGGRGAGLREGRRAPRSHSSELKESPEVKVSATEARPKASRGKPRKNGSASNRSGSAKRSRR
jgi:hypothetical protein